jgi:uncharacterized membrane-anchored protein YitT (DUF2179 family)
MKLSSLKPYLLIIIGDMLLACGITIFLEPHQLVTGGVSGLAIIIADYTGRAGFTIPIWLTNLALNVPLFLLGLRTMGRRFLIRTAFATGFLSVALFITGFFPPLPEIDLTLAALFGGVSSGLGLGLVFKSMATTGGSDLLAGILHRHWLRHYSISKILFAVDSLIIIFGLVVFGPVNAMYAVVAVFVTSKVSDTMLEGLSFAKAAFIISDHTDTIAEGVLHKLNRGATDFSGRGMYTRKQKNMLLCVVSAKEIAGLKALVHEVDAQAFVIVADVHEVLGEGFKEGEQMFPIQM